MQPCLLLSLLLVWADFMLQWQSCIVATETIWLIQPEIFTLWLLTESLPTCVLEKKRKKRKDMDILCLLFLCRLIFSKYALNNRQCQQQMRVLRYLSIYLSLISMEGCCSGYQGPCGVVQKGTCCRTEQNKTCGLGPLAHDLPLHQLQGPTERL